jgi:hypothetical protein
LESEDLQQGMAIVDSPVCLVEEAGPIQKVAEARTFVAVLALRPRSRSSPRLSARKLASNARRIEAGVVRDDNRRILDENRDGRSVDPLPDDHLVGNAGERRYLGRDRDGWFIERGEDVPDADDAAVGQVVESTIPSSMTSSFRGSRPVVSLSRRMPVVVFSPTDGVKIVPGDQTSQNTVIRRSAQRLGHCG